MKILKNLPAFEEFICEGYINENLKIQDLNYYYLSTSTDYPKDDLSTIAKILGVKSATDFYVFGGEVEDENNQTLNLDDYKAHSQFNQYMFFNYKDLCVHDSDDIPTNWPKGVPIDGFNNKYKIAYMNDYGYEVVFVPKKIVISDLKKFTPKDSSEIEED